MSRVKSEDKVNFHGIISFRLLPFLSCFICEREPLFPEWRTRVKFFSMRKLKLIWCFVVFHVVVVNTHAAIPHTDWCASNKLRMPSSIEMVGFQFVSWKNVVVVLGDNNSLETAWTCVKVTGQLKLYILWAIWLIFKPTDPIVIHSADDMSVVVGLSLASWW